MPRNPVCIPTERDRSEMHVCVYVHTCFVLTFLLNVVFWTRNCIRLLGNSVAPFACSSHVYLVGSDCGWTVLAGAACCLMTSVLAL